MSVFYLMFINDDEWGFNSQILKKVVKTKNEMERKEGQQGLEV